MRRAADARVAERRPAVDALGHVGFEHDRDRLDARAEGRLGLERHLSDRVVLRLGAGKRQLADGLAHRTAPLMTPAKATMLTSRLSRLAPSTNFISRQAPITWARSSSSVSRRCVDRDHRPLLDVDAVD